MAFPIWLLAVAAFLSGGVAAVFVMLVIGIHKGDRARDLSDAPRSRWMLTRCMLGVGLRSGCPAGHKYDGEN